MYVVVNICRIDNANYAKRYRLQYHNQYRRIIGDWQHIPFVFLYLSIQESRIHPSPPRLRHYQARVGILNGTHLPSSHVSFGIFCHFRWVSNVATAACQPCSCRCTTISPSTRRISSIGSNGITSCTPFGSTQ
jgi:hypothetical protein